MVVILIALRNEGPRVGSEDGIRGTTADVRIAVGVAPHVPIRLRVGLVLLGLDEPCVLIRRVVQHEVDDHAHAAVVSLFQQRVEVGQRPVVRVDVLVVRNVVAGIRERRRHDGHEPNGVHTKCLELVEPRGEPGDVTDAVAVAVLKRAHVHFVEHRVAVPVRPLQEARGFGRAVLLGETRRLLRVVTGAAAAHERGGEGQGMAEAHAAILPRSVTRSAASRGPERFPARRPFSPSERFPARRRAVPPRAAIAPSRVTRTVRFRTVLRACDPRQGCPAISAPRASREPFGSERLSAPQIPRRSSLVARCSRTRELANSRTRDLVIS